MLDEKLLGLNESWVEFQATLNSTSRVLLCLGAGPTRERLAELARGATWIVEEVGSAEEAVQHLAQDAVDLLVVAEDPPDMGALALARYARGRPVTPKILVLSQNPSPRKVLEAIRLGVLDYLLEPEQAPDEVFERMRRRMDQLNKQKLQVVMLTDLRRFFDETPSEERALLVSSLKGRLERHRREIGPMNRVLCADADPILRRQLCATMGGLGLVPVECLGGQSAITLLEDEGADLVLLSGTLPDLPLRETLERIHEVAGPIPVVLLASVEDVDAALTALRMGFADTFRKPIPSPEQAAHRVARMLKDRRRELLAENLVRELYRLIRTASASIRPEAMGQVESVFDDIVVLPDEAMEAMETAPVARPGTLGQAVAAGAVAELQSDSSAATPPPTPRAALPGSDGDEDDLAIIREPLPSVRLTSGEFQVIADGNRHDVLEVESLPDTVVIRYIDELLFPEASKQLPGSLGAGQRLTPRVERSTFVRYGASGTEQASLGYAHDLSLGGMFILSDAPPPVGTDLRIELQLPDGNRLERIRVQGRVMWHTNPERLPPQGDGFGVQFTVVDRTASNALLRVLNAENR